VNQIGLGMHESQQFPENETRRAWNMLRWSNRRDHNRKVRKTLILKPKELRFLAFRLNSLTN